MSAYGWDPSNDDRSYRQRAIQAEAVNTPIADVLDFIGGDVDAQGVFEDFLQKIRSEPANYRNVLSLSIFLDDQAEARAAMRLRRAA